MSLAGLSPALRSHVEHQRVAMLFSNTLAYTESAILMVGFVALVVWNSLDWRTLLVWCGAILGLQGLIQWVSHRYRASPTGEASARRWGWIYSGTVAVSGAAWGSGVFLLHVDNAPLLQAFIAVVLAGRGTASMLAHAYFPPALYAFATPLFLCLATRYVTLGETANVATGLMWLLFLAYVLLFGHRQAKVIVDSIVLRHEKEQLVEALERKNAAEERARVRAEEANLAKSRFFAAANHDLRQPLHSLGLFATTLRNTVTGREHRELVDHILLGIESLDSLFEDLLDISKLDAGQVRARLGRFALGALLARIEPDFRPIAAAKGLSLEVEAADSPIVETDAVLLERVVRNLVDNAIKYTTRGSVRLRTEQVANRALLTVADTGRGIPREEHERVFEEFYQLSNPERDRSRGIGLGLAIVRRLTDLLGVEMRFDSDLGRGTTFVLSLPVAEKRPVAAGESAHAAQSEDTALPEGMRVLVVDDEGSVRQGMRTLLETWNCGVTLASDIAEALAALEEDGADLIIADQRLRNSETGTELVRRARGLVADVPALLITGDTAPDVLLEAEALGVTLLHKPVSERMLRRAIAAAVR